MKLVAFACCWRWASSAPWPWSRHRTGLLTASTGRWVPTFPTSTPPAPMCWTAGPPRRSTRGGNMPANRRMFGNDTGFYGWHYPPFFLGLAALLGADALWAGALLVWQGVTLRLYLLAMRAIVSLPPPGGRGSRAASGAGWGTAMTATTTLPAPASPTSPLQREGKRCGCSSPSPSRPCSSISARP